MARSMGKPFVVAMLLAVMTTGIHISARAQSPATNGGSAARRPVLTEQDAVRVLDRMRQSLEANSRSKFLKLFDAARMPGYPAFRDEVSQFFLQYEGFRVQYRLEQVSQDADLGAAVCDFTLEALSSNDGLPALRRNAQMRLVLSRDGKDWKIADLSPRSFFR